MVRLPVPRNAGELTEISIPTSLGGKGCMRVYSHPRFISIYYSLPAEWPFQQNVYP